MANSCLPPTFDNRFELDPASRWINQTSANTVSSRLCDCIDGLLASDERTNGELPPEM